MSVENLSAAIDGRLLPTILEQVFPTRRHLDLQLLGRCGDDLAKSRKRVPTRLEVAVPKCPDEEQHQCHKRGARGCPEPECPQPLILKVAQDGVGEERAEVQGQVEVAEEGDFGPSFSEVLLIELVRAEGANVWLIASISQGNQVDCKVK